MINVCCRIAKAIEHDVSSAAQRAEVLRSNFSNCAWAKPLSNHMDALVYEIGNTLNSAMALQGKLEELKPERSITAQRLIDDIMTLIPFIQAHEELFDDLNTNYSLDETLTIAAQRIKEHADIMFSGGRKEKDFSLLR